MANGTVTHSMTSNENSDLAVSVVIPAYNEVNNVEPLLEELTDVLESTEMERFSDYEVVLVDDGSDDGTRKIVAEVAEKRDEATAILLRRNFGKSAALEAGFQHAQGDVVTTIDADMQDDPKMIPLLVDKLFEGYDCVSGWRRRRQDPVMKRLPSLIQTYLAWITGPKIHDYVCGLKVYRYEAIENLRLYGEQHRYIPAMLHKQGYRITEKEVNHRSRKHGVTKYGPARLIKGSLDLIFNAFWNRYSTRPLHFFGGAGIAFFTLGTLIGLHLVYENVFLNEAFTPHLPRLVLVTTTVLFGAVLFLIGFITEIMVKTNYEPGDAYSVERVID